jgi:c-di-GMP-related signal transduction protein
MRSFVARQAIFERSLDVYGYELLFRAGPEAFFSHDDQDEASSRVIEESLMVFGLETLASGRRIFVNATRRVMTEELYRVLPPERSVIELLETVEPDAEVVAACRALKDTGYLLALDDFVYTPAYEPLLDLADIVKIDFRATSVEERRGLADRLRRRGRKLLAEKLETPAEFNEAVREGFDYLQGHFFCRPKLITAKDIPAFKLHSLAVLHEMHKPDLDFDALAATIEREVSLTVKLLRYLNSAAFGWRAPVETVRQALFILGEVPFRRWATVVLLAGLGSDQPAELSVTSLMRARFASRLAEDLRLASPGCDLFLAGLLSLLDAFTGLPLAEALRPLGLSEEMERALLGEETPAAQVITLVVAYERAQWGRVGALATALGANESRLPLHYGEAVTWSAQVFKV